jgi:nucleotide-binding universal stress UspA family protein
MYQRILLAYDGSLEGRRALREGALLAKVCGAQVYLLSIVPDSPGMRVAEGAFAGVLSQQADHHRSIFDEGVARLRQVGMEPVARQVQDEPARAIASFANEVDADLVVVGHRRRSLAERWWSGPGGAYLADYLRCSVLVARRDIDDATFLAEITAPG